MAGGLCTLAEPTKSRPNGLLSQTTQPISVAPPTQPGANAAALPPSSNLYLVSTRIIVNLSGS